MSYPTGKPEPCRCCGWPMLYRPGQIVMRQAGVDGSPETLVEIEYARADKSSVIYDVREVLGRRWGYPCCQTTLRRATKAELDTMWPNRKGASHG